MKISPKNVDKHKNKLVNVPVKVYIMLKVGILL